MPATMFSVKVHWPLHCILQTETPSIMALKFVNLVLLVAFTLSAAVQYNDPDALVWVAIYLAAAAMCLLQYRHNGRRWLPPALLVIALAWIATLLQALSGRFPWKRSSRPSVCKPKRWKRPGKSAACPWSPSGPVCSHFASVRVDQHAVKNQFTTFDLPGFALPCGAAVTS